MKKILLCFFIAINVFFLSSCGKKSSALKIGIIGPLTGEMAQYGKPIEKAIRLCVDEYNKKKDDKNKIECVSFDNQGDTSKAVLGFDALADDNVAAIIGDAGSAQTLAIVPKSYQIQMPLITPSSTAAEVTENKENGMIYNNVFRTCFIDSWQGEKMAEFCVKELGVKNVSVLFCLENDHSIQAKQAFVSKIRELGGEILNEESFSTTAVDYTAQLTKIASKKPEALFVPYYYNSMSLIAPSARNVGITCPMIGTDGWDSILDVISDKKNIEGCYYCSSYSADNEENEVCQEFVKKYQEKYKEIPNGFAALGYDAALILLDTIDKVVERDIKPGSESFQKEIIRLMKTNKIKGVTGTIVFDDNNNPKKEVPILKVESGKAKLWKIYDGENLVEE